MSTFVHYMAVEADRKLVPARAERGRQVDEALAGRRTLSPLTALRTGCVAAATLIRSRVGFQLTSSVRLATGRPVL